MSEDYYQILYRPKNERCYKLFETFGSQRVVLMLFEESGIVFSDAVLQKITVLEERSVENVSKNKSDVVWILPNKEN